MNYIVIGGAWPYANGPLHIGHISGLLNGDILARYHRLKGDKVLYVSGSDCHGTPITLKSIAQNESPEAISESNHQAILQGFNELDFSYDCYGTTKEAIHYENAQKFFEALDANGHVYERISPQHYCPVCEQFLADRYIIATCPNCGATAKGDECDFCNNPINLETLKDGICAICNTATQHLDNKNLYFKLSDFQNTINQLIDQHTADWRANAIQLTKRYLDEGLRDRAYSRDLDWGIPLTKEGYTRKTIYIWLENVLGYNSMVRKWSAEHNEDPNHYLKTSPQLKTYYVHAKDNIPFHTIILPALLEGAKDNYALPDQIISNEYLTLEGQKISTSRDWALWVNDLTKRYDSDSLRHYLTFNSPEKKDANFTFQDFIHTHNSDLVGQLGNLVNRTLVFVNKYFYGQILRSKPNPKCDPDLSHYYKNIGSLIENGHIKDSYRLIFKLIHEANGIFNDKAPWLTRTTHPDQCIETLLSISHLILNIANLLQPFLPKTSKAIFASYQVARPREWLPISEPSIVTPVADLKLLFQKIPKEQIDIERAQLAASLL